MNGPLGKVARLLAPDHERPDNTICANQRHDEARPKSGPHRDLSDRAWRLVANICDLKWLSVLDRLAERIGSTGWLASDCRNQLIAQAIRCTHLQCLVQLIKDIDHTSIRVRKLDRLSDDRGQHGLEIEGGVYCLGHLTESTQLFNGVCEFASSRLHLVEQPGVLDGDHRLVGERGDQHNLLLGERFDALPLQDDYPNRSTFAQQRHSEHRTNIAELHPLSHSVFRIGLNIMHMNYLAFESDPSGDRSPAWLQRMAFHHLLELG